jgi:hypothetical protein
MAAAAEVSLSSAGPRYVIFECGEIDYGSFDRRSRGFTLSNVATFFTKSYAKIIIKYIEKINQKTLFNKKKKVCERCCAALFTNQTHHHTIFSSHS